MVDDEWKNVSPASKEKSKMEDFEKKIKIIWEFYENTSSKEKEVQLTTVL